MTQISWHALAIDRSLSTPLFEQVCIAIRKQIISGELRQGKILLPTRSFATELGVSRSTIVTAYEQLVAEGYLSSAQGSGHKVCNIGEVELAALRPQPDEVWENQKPQDPRPFKAGQPDMRLFPHRQWAKTVARVCRVMPKTMLMGSGLFGNTDLRKAIAKHIAEWRGIIASPEQIIVTAGAGDALEICMRTLAASGDRVGLEDPGYPPLLHFIKSQGLKPAYLKVDEQGANLPRSEKKMNLCVLTPSHQFPLGGAMSPNRRIGFIKWAEANDGWIIEDDYDSEFRFSGRPIPAMAGFDQLNKTIYVGSFSKIFSNSLRLGYIVVPHVLTERFRTEIMVQGQRASSMPQQALALFIQSGEFYRHLRRMRRIYGERRKNLLARLTQGFAEYGSFVDHHAGMQVVFNLNNNLNDKQVILQAEKRGVEVEALSVYCHNRSTYNGLVLGYCGFAETEQADALIGLKQACQASIKKNDL